MRSDLDRLCESKNLRAVVKLGGPDNPDFPRSTAWTVTLHYRRRRLTVPFYTGSGWTGEPNASDVLTCLLDDALSVDVANGFDDWARDLGYDPDSRKAERIYRAFKRVSRRLRRFLGDDFDTFRAAERG